jgi:hypothetical protein
LAEIIGAPVREACVRNGEPRCLFRLMKLCQPDGFHSGRFFLRKSKLCLDRRSFRSAYTALLPDLRGKRERAAANTASSAYAQAWRPASQPQRKDPPCRGCLDSGSVGCIRCGPKASIIPSCETGSARQISHDGKCASNVNDNRNGLPRSLSQGHHDMPRFFRQRESVTSATWPRRVNAPASLHEKA